MFGFNITARCSRAGNVRNETQSRHISIAHPAYPQHSASGHVFWTLSAFVAFWSLIGGVDGGRMAVIDLQVVVYFFVRFFDLSSELKSGLTDVFDGWVLCVFSIPGWRL